MSATSRLGLTSSTVDSSSKTSSDSVRTSRECSSRYSWAAFITASWKRRRVSPPSLPTSREVLVVKEPSETRSLVEPCEVSWKLVVAVALRRISASALAVSVDSEVRPLVAFSASAAPAASSSTVAPAAASPPARTRCPEMVRPACSEASAAMAVPSFRVRAARSVAAHGKRGHRPSS